MKTPYIDNVDQLMKKFPKSFDLLNEKIIENIKKVDGIEEDLKEVLGDNLIRNIVTFDCRKLFDFFDEQEIFCSTTYNITTEKWDGVVMDTKFEGYEDRHSLEIAMFENSFEKLEKLL